MVWGFKQSCFAQRNLGRNSASGMCVIFICLCEIWKIKKSLPICLVAQNKYNRICDNQQTVQVPRSPAVITTGRRFTCYLGGWLRNEVPARVAVVSPQRRNSSKINSLISSFRDLLSPQKLSPANRDNNKDFHHQHSARNISREQFPSDLVSCQDLDGYPGGMQWRVNKSKPKL